MKTIAEEYEAFALATVPPSAGPAQRFAIRAAFYSGALVMFNLTNEIALTDASEDVACSRLDKLFNELTQHAVDLQVGL